MDNKGYMWEFEPKRVWTRDQYETYGKAWAVNVLESAKELLKLSINEVQIIRAWLKRIWQCNAALCGAFVNWYVMEQTWSLLLKVTKLLMQKHPRIRFLLPFRTCYPPRDMFPAVSHPFV